MKLLESIFLEDGRRLLGKIGPLLLFMGLLAGCNLSTQPARPTTDPTRTFTPLPTQTPTPTPTYTPTFISLAHIGTPIAPQSEEITRGNADRLVLFASRGKGIPRQLALAPNSKLFAVASTQGLFIFNTETLQETAEILPGEAQHCLAFSISGNLLAAGSDDGVVRLWQVKDQKLIFEVKADDFPILSLSFSPDEKLLGISSWEKTLNTINLSNGSISQNFGGLLGAVTNTGFSPDGSSFFSWAPKEPAKVWTISIGKSKREIYVGNDELGKPSINAAFSGNGSFFAVNYGMRIKIFRTANGTTLRMLRESSEPVDKVVLSDDGKMLAAIKKSGINIWGVADGKLVRQILLTGDQAPFSFSVFSADDSHLLTLNEQLKSWSLTDVGKAEISRTAEFVSDPVISSSLNLTHNALILVLTNAQLQHYNFTDGTAHDAVFLSHNPTGITSLSPLGTLAAVAERDGKILLVNLANSSALKTLDGQKGEIRSLAFSADGSRLATAADDESVLVWQVPEGDLLKIFNLDSPAQQIFFSTDARLIAMRTSTAIFIYDLDNGNLLLNLPGYSMEISPDGKQLAALSIKNGESIISVYALGSGKELSQIGAATNDITISPDGKILATIGHPIKLWDISSGSLITSLENPGVYGHLFFSQDGKILILSDWDGAFQFWGIP